MPVLSSAHSPCSPSLPFCSFCFGGSQKSKDSSPFSAEGAAAAAVDQETRIQPTTTVPTGWATTFSSLDLVRKARGCLQPVSLRRRSCAKCPGVLVPPSYHYQLIPTGSRLPPVNLSTAEDSHHRRSRLFHQRACSVRQHTAVHRYLTLAGRNTFPLLLPSLARPNPA